MDGWMDGWMDEVMGITNCIPRGFVNGHRTGNYGAGIAFYRPRGLMLELWGGSSRCLKAFDCFRK